MVCVEESFSYIIIIMLDVRSCNYTVFSALLYRAHNTRQPMGK